MSNKDNGGPAFPSTYEARSDQGRGPIQQFHSNGMTLRDYFAAKVMQGYWSDSRFNKIGMDVLARHCYAMADAMLEVRNQ